MFCGLLNLHCTYTLTTKEENTFKNQDGVPGIQASAMEPGGHCAGVFRHIPVLLRTGIF